MSLPNAFGQTVGPVPNLAVEFSPQFYYDYSSKAYFSHIYYSKVASSAQVAPELKSAGKVETTFIRAGLRTKDFDSFDFRWGAGLLRMDLIRTPFSMGVTLIDFNRTGLLDLDINWVNIRLGPSMYLGNPSTYFILRAVGQGGISTLKLGTFSYTGLASRENLNLRKRSYELGYMGEFQFFLARTIFLSGSFAHRSLLGGIRPKFYIIEGSFGIRFSEFISTVTTYSIQLAKVENSSLKHSYIGFGIGIAL